MSQTTPPEGDEAIARRVQDGDVNAFGLLVERYEQKLRRYARRFLFDRNDADDLIQDTFLKAYEGIQGYDPDKKFSPWIYRIAHNVFLNELRARGSRPILSFDFDTIFAHIPARETADDLALRSEEKERVAKALRILDPKYREPLILFYFEDMAYREIADVLDIPTATVGVRIARAKQMVRKTLQDLKDVYE